MTSGGNHGLTVQRDEHRRRLPDPPPPRVGGDTEEDGETGDDAKPDAELPKVARGAPDHTERLVLLLAAVLHAHREGAALVVGVRYGAAAGAGDLDDAELAAAVEAIFDDDLVVDDVGVLDDEPGASAVSMLPARRRS